MRRLRGCVYTWQNEDREECTEFSSINLMQSCCMILFRSQNETLIIPSLQAHHRTQHLSRRERCQKAPSAMVDLAGICQNRTRLMTRLYFCVMLPLCHAGCYSRIGAGFPCGIRDIYHGLSKTSRAVAEMAVSSIVFHALFINEPYAFIETVN